MGTWGTSLYQDDDAADLKNTIGLLSRMPADGDRLMEILLESRGGAAGSDDDGGPAFWLVVADQFEKRGIVCHAVKERALAVIQSGADLRDLEARGATAKDLAQRTRLLNELATRLRSPRPARTRPKGGKPPAFVVDVGEVYRFPTMRSVSFNAWYATWEAAGFAPDGWGALLVVGRGRVFDWFPWCAVTSLTVPSSKRPAMDSALAARFISADRGAGYCVPRTSHLKRMKMELIGRVNLDPTKAAETISDEFTPQYAVLAGWSFIAQASGWQGKSAGGTALADLIE